MAERDGHGWTVRIDGLAGPDRVHARDLADVEPRARKLIWAYTGDGVDDIQIDVQVSLPPTIQDRLDVIRQHCTDIETEYDAAIAELIEAGLSVLDVGRVLRLHHRAPRPLTVTNAEVAEYGLFRHPDAIGLEWDDHGHYRTVKCRAHVEATRKEYVELPPEGENALLYAGNGFECHFCDEVPE
jgi:hypothetical protein